MKQVTEEEAIKLADSDKWKGWTDEEVVKFQLYQDRLCMDFRRFHEAVENVLDRSVFTHEFANVDKLREEYEGKRGKPSFGEIFGDLCDLVEGDTKWRLH